MIKTLKINFHGHAMFTVESPSDSLTIGFDPFNEQVKNKLPDVTAHLVLISHYHFDHANATLFKGNPKIIDSPGNYTYSAIDITGIQSYHDKTRGFERGKNVIYRLRIGDYTLAHLGDLGEIPDKKVLDALEGLDILMIPVGGTYTIDHSEAMEIIAGIKPKIAIPMHFKEKDTNIAISDINSFENIAVNSYPVKKIQKSLELSKDKIPRDTEIWIMSSV